MKRVTFRRLNAFERVLEFFFPGVRAARAARLRARIDWLVDNPDVPVSFK